MTAMEIFFIIFASFTGGVFVHMMYVALRQYAAKREKTRLYALMDAIWPYEEQ